MRLGAALLVLVAVIAVVVLLSGGSDDDDADTAIASPTIPSATVPSPSPTPSPTPTLETAPDVTPTPVQGSEGPAPILTLVEAPAGLLQFVTDGPYVVPGDAQGIFYLDIETRAIVGWADLIGDTRPIASSGDNRFSVFERRDQTFQGGVTYPAGTYLADRETRAVYRWDGDAELALEKQAFNPGEIATRGALVLFRLPVDQADDRFSLIDVETGEVVTSFQAEATWAVISEDATKIALAGEDVFVVDVASGGLEPIADGVLETIDLEGEFELTNSPDGESFGVFSKPVKDRFSGVALR